MTGSTRPSIRSAIGKSIRHTLELLGNVVNSLIPEIDVPLKQALLVSTAPTISGVIADERTGLGDARPFQPKRAREFDGVDDVVNLPNDSALQITGDYTISGWIKCDNYISDFTNVAVFSRWKNLKGYMLFGASGSIRLYRNSSFITSAANLSAYNGEWVHVAATANGTAGKIYVNGVLENTGAFSAATHTNATLTNPQLGSYADSAGDTIDGLMVDVRIYDRPLTASEISNIYNAPTVNIYPDDLIDMWKMEGTHPTIEYSAIGGIDGTKTNGTTVYEGDDVPYSYQNEVGYSGVGYFNGSTSNVNLGDKYDYTDNFTISGTFASDNTTDGVIFSRRNLSDHQYEIDVDDTTKKLRFKWGGGLASSTTDVYDGGVFDFEININGSSSTISINGVVETTFNPSIASHTIDAVIGSRENQAATFTGFIGNIEIKENGTRVDYFRGGVSDYPTGSVTDVDDIYIPRDESDTANDVLGNALQFKGEVPRNGQAVNSPCVDLNGTNAEINTGVPSNFANELVMFCEFSPDAVTASNSGAYRLFQLSNTNSTKVALAVDNSKVVMFYNFGSSVFTDGIAVSSGDTVKACIRKTADKVQLFVNGALIDEASGVLDTVNSEPIIIGSQNSSSSRFFDGKVWNAQFYNTGLTEADCIQLTADGNPIGTPFRHWPMSETAGSNIANVSSVGGDATYINGNARSTQDVFHYALAKGFDRVGSFDGANDYITIPTVTFAGDFEIEMLINSPTSTSSMVFSGGTGATGFELYDTSIGVAVYQAGVWKNEIVSSTIQGTGWRKLKVARVGSTVTGFVDDIQQASRTISGTLTITQLGRRASGGLYFTGGLAEVKFIDDGTLVAHYPMVSADGTNVPDISPNSNDGTLVGDDGSNFWATEIPAAADGSSLVGRAEPSNPAGAYHNGGVTDIELIDGTWSFNDDRTNPHFRRENDGNGNADRFLSYDEVLTGDDLRIVEDFTTKQTLNTLFVGQSNMTKPFTDYSGAGITQFVTTSSQYFDTVNTVNGGRVSSAVHFDAAGSEGAFLNATNDGKGENYTDYLEAAMTASGLSNNDIDFIPVLIGETDSVAVNDGTITKAQHKEAYRTLINLLKADFPNATVLPIALMADTNGTQFTGWGLVRQAQFEVFVEENLEDMPAMYDLSFQDDLHPNQAGYEEMMRRIAERIAALLGKRSEVGTLGPKAISGTFDPDTQLTQMVIEHDGGTDFTLSEDKGLNPLVNGSAVGVNSATRLTSTTFQTSHNGGTFSSGDTVLFQWAWGTLRNSNRNNILIDNATNPLPLRRSFDISLTEV